VADQAGGAYGDASPLSSRHATSPESAEGRRLRILFAGATGVLGRATLPHLRGHDVVGLTRSAEKTDLLRELDAEAEICDVYDYPALVAIAVRVRPQIVVNFITDLSSGSGAANNRARREGGDNLRNAATAAGATRLVVESVAFRLEGEAADAVDYLERQTRAFAGDALLVRFGRLWGPGTFHRSPPPAPAVHIDRAGVEAARLLTSAPPGTYVVT
jgi:NAD-dependent epimerase/dehydratase family protein